MSLFRSMGYTNPAAPSDRRKVWNDFRNDHKTLTMLRVTPEEVARLQTVFLLSRFTERRQLLEALNRIRWRP